MITQPTPQEYSEIIELWEASVRSTHHFLTENDIQFYKALILEQYLPCLEVYIMRNTKGNIAAFMGLSDSLIEMLFVHPLEQGKGYGKKLINYALCRKQIEKVDVNEQNEKALNFYRHLGFHPIGRDAFDSSGKPYSILHLRLLKNWHLETERLLLRPFAETDLQDFFECCQNPNLGNNAGWKPHDTIEESREVLHGVFLNQENIWAMVSKETHRLVGSIGLVPDPKRENPHTAMLGYWLRESHWGQGLMSEAVEAVLAYGFNILKLSLISADCYPHNRRSQQVLERNGFIYEGLLHQAELTYDGKIYDHLCYYLASGR